jgi:hypothetical protein
MTDWRLKIYDFIDSKVSADGFATINAASNFKEPEKYVSFFPLSDDTLTTSTGERVYNVTDDLVDVSYSPISQITLQIDVRDSAQGASNEAFSKSEDLYFRFQTQEWINELKAQGVYYMGIGNKTPIPNLQNGYIKSGYQFTIWIGYDTTITNQVDYGDTLTLNKE